MEQAWHERLLPAAEDFKPNMVLISCGFDSREGDPLGTHRVTDAGFARLTSYAMELSARHCDGALISVLEGGYAPHGMASAVHAHVRTLARSTSGKNGSHADSIGG